MNPANPKTSIDHLVLLTDLTGRSDSALSYARAFAQYYSSRLTVVHAISDRSGSHDVRRARAELRTVVNGLHSAGIEAHCHVTGGRSRREALQGAVHYLNPDLIVQGTAGVSDPRRVLLGSVAEGMLRSVDTPVLTVSASVPPYTKEGLEFRSMLFITDFGKKSDVEAIYALSLAQEFKAKISLCHVHDEMVWPWKQGEVQRFFQDVLARHITSDVRDWCEPEAIVQFGDVDAELRLLILKKRPDLLLLGAHHLGLMGTRGKPGLAFRLIADAICPVLSMLDHPQTLALPPRLDSRRDVAILA